MDNQCLLCFHTMNDDRVKHFLRLKLKNCNKENYQMFLHQLIIQAKRKNSLLLLIKKSIMKIQMLKLLHYFYATQFSSWAQKKVLQTYSQRK